MAQVRNKVLAGEHISRAQLDTAGDPSEADIAAALDAWDHERAAMLAIARARTAPVPIALVARILPGIEFAPIICALLAIAEGDRTTLLDVLERRRFPQTKDTAELEAIVLYAAWKAGAPAARLAPEVRRLSVRSMTAEGYALLATIAQAIDDPNVAAVVKPIAAFAKEHAKSVAADERAMTAKLDAVIAALPADVEISRGGFTVRAQKQVGRNDPCPCGSGLKYKKCCADKEVAITPSPITGVSWEDFLGPSAGQMTMEHVNELALRDLVRVELGRLEPKPLVAAARKLADAHAWAHAERAIDELARRDARSDTGGSWADDCRDWLIHAALGCGEIGLVRAHVAELPRELAKLYDLDLAIDTGPAEAWEALVRVARETVASADKLADVDLAYTLLRAEPALGIVAARSCIGTLRVDDADILLDSVEAARDELGLPPADPAWDVLDALTVKKRGGGDDEAGKLKETLLASTTRADELERSLAALRTELAAERTKPAAELMRTPERAGQLDDRVHELEALIREGNAERRELRRQLEQTAPKAPRGDEPRSRRATVEDADEGVDNLAPGARGITLPRFDRRFTDAVADVPATVAAEAMRTIGTLSAGDGFAWRGVKQAKDMPRQVLMARVGIHHRLVFRCEDGMLDVLDLITRETLMTTLKRLRGAR